MLIDRLSIFRSIFPDRRTARTVAARWARAASDQPMLINDLIGMGAVLALQLRSNGLPDTDPQRLAYEAGRRDLALELLAMAGVSRTDLNTLSTMMEKDRYETD
ncbi:hypothetical protein [Pararhodobacter sp.]|uniref:hypothetical protein n=1 Tax=Pararhodobacter sp. TaxID=2127056 RepID=UPI002FDE560F